MPKISVALAAYNGQKYIEKQLRSLAAQTMRVDEVVVTDDASDDGTVQIVRRFIQENRLTGWRVAPSQQNQGYFENFRRAIGQVSGDFIFLCDQDDIWDVRKVERCMQAFEENPQAELVCTGYDTIDEHDAPCEAPGVRFVDRVFDASREWLRADSFIGCSYIRGFSIAFRAPLRDAVVWSNPGRLLSHDWLICLTAAAMRPGALSHPRCLYLHENLAHYRVHGQNVTARTQGQGLIDTRTRVKALEDSRAAHAAFLEAFMALRGRDAACLTREETRFVLKMKRQIAWEGKRLRFMHTKKPLHFLALALRAPAYRCYYHSFWSGLRVLAGDWVYTCRKDGREKHEDH